MDRTGLQKHTDVVVLAGGMANRMKSLRAGVPKPFLPVCGQSFAFWQMHELVRACPAVRRAIFILRGVDAPLFQNLAADLPMRGLCLAEESAMGTGGAILQALANAGIYGLSDPFLVINGDVLFTMTPSLLLAEAIRHGSAIQGIHVSDTARYGTLEIQNGMCAAFHEKTGLAESGWINAGLYAFTHEALSAFPLKACSFEKEIAPILIALAKCAVVKTESDFIDIGTPQDYARADTFLSASGFEKRAVSGA